MLGKTTTFFNRNPMVLQTHPQNLTIRMKRSQRIVVVKTENVVPVMRREEEMIEIGMIIIEGTETGIVIGEGMTIRVKGIDIEVVMTGEDPPKDLRAGIVREAGVGANLLKGLIIEAAGKETLKRVDMLSRRNTRGPVIKWRIWRN